jgi:hypothetical protein
VRREPVGISPDAWAGFLGAVVGGATGFWGPLVVQGRQQKDSEQASIAKVRAKTNDWGAYLEEVIDDACDRAVFPTLSEFDAIARSLRSVAEEALSPIAKGKATEFYKTVGDELRAFHDEVRNAVARRSRSDACLLKYGFSAQDREEYGFRRWGPGPELEDDWDAERAEPLLESEGEEPEAEESEGEEPEAELEIEGELNPEGKLEIVMPESGRRDPKARFAAYPGGVTDWLDESAAEQLPPKLADEWQELQARRSPPDSSRP